MMKKIFFVWVALVGMMGNQAMAQCLDSVPWGTPLTFESSCCWTVAPGSNWYRYGYFNQVDSDGDPTTDHRILSPWVQVPATAEHDSVALMYVTGSVCHEDYSVCVTTDGILFDTLFRGWTPNEEYYDHDTLFMGAYAGQWVRIELCHYVLNRNQVPDSACLDSYTSGDMLFELIKLESTVLPEVSMSVPQKAFVGDSVEWQAGLFSGSATGLAYHWHSSLMDSTIVTTSSTASIVYDRAGIDNISLVAVNAFGSGDTMTAATLVIDCRGVVTAHPWYVDFAQDFDCWQTVGAYGWASYYYNGTPGIVGSNSGGHSTIASPAVALPADSTGLRLYWKDRRLNNTATYYVLVSRGDRFDLDDYDTIFSGTPAGTNLTQRSVSLAGYAGDTVYVAFRQMYQSGRRAYITDVKMYNALAPLATLEAPTYGMATGDTVRYTVHPTQGDAITYSWHSTLLDSSRVTPDSTVTVVYPEAGSETLTVTVSNVYGALVLEKSLGVFDCDTIGTFPYEEEFVATGIEAGYNVCWQMEGWNHAQTGVTYVCYDEDGAETIKNDIMRSQSTVNYMELPPIRVPAEGAERLKLWLQYAQGNMTVTASTDGGQSWPDTLYNFTPSDNYYLLRSIPLRPYAGQTVKLRLNAGSYVYLDRVAVDYDTTPRVSLASPATTTTGNAALCVATLRYGDTAGLTYTWHSAVGGSFVTNAAGDSAWVTYGAGITGLHDTVSVVVSNLFGSDTACNALRVIDCMPQTTLPWTENFSDGIVCWYKPEGSNWAASTFYGYEPKAMASNCIASDTACHWIVSKAVDLPEETELCVRLFWDICTSYDNPQKYSVMVTTAEDYTDTASYTLLCLDTASHSSYRTFDHMSASLAPYAGQTVHVAFRNMPSSCVTLYIDNVCIRTSAVPVVTIDVPAAVESYEETSYRALLAEGSRAGITYTWHSSLMDTTIVTTDSLLTMVYDRGGVDTLTLVAANTFGADTATRVVTVGDCTPIATLPWMEDFSAITPVAYNAAGGLPPACWRTCWNGSNANLRPHVIDSYPYGALNSIAANMKPMVLLAGTDEGYDSVAVVETPAFAGSLNGKRLAFYYNYEYPGMGTLSVGYMLDGAFTSLAVMGSADHDTVLLSGIPDGVHRVAFQWKKTGTWYGAVIDVITLLQASLEPHIVLCPPASAMVGDTTVYQVRVTDGSSDSLRFVWHSSLMDTTIVTVEPAISIVYDTEGEDVVSVVAINAYGADSAAFLTTVGSHPLPQVTLTAPSAVTLPDTAWFTVAINDCSPNALQVTLHSSMLGMDVTDATGTISLVYNNAGTDTVTVVASNAYGADTATALVQVVNCAGRAVPYLEDFEGVATASWSAAGSLPPCWTSSNNGTSAAHAPHVIGTTGYTYITLPDKALFMVAGSGNMGTQADAVLPHFEVGLQSLLLALDYRFESANQGTLSVGYYDDMGTFVAVDTLPAHTGSYRRDTVSFAAVTAPDARMVLRWSQSSSYWAAVIDNIEVFVDNGIPAPSNLTAGNVTASCVTLRWSEVDTATAYHLSVTDGQGTVVFDSVLTDTTLTFCGLMQDADFSVRLKAMVGSAEGLTATGSFHTLMRCAPLASVSVSSEGIISWQYDTLVAELEPSGVEIAIIDHQGQVLVYTDTAWFSPYVPAGLIPGHTYSFAVRTLCSDAADNTADTVVLQVTPSVCAEVAGTGVNTNSRFMDNFWDANYSQVLYPSSLVNGVDTLYGIALRVAQFTGHYYTSQTYRFDIYVGQTTASSLTSPLTSDSLTAVAQNKSFTVSEAGWVNIPFDSIFFCDYSKNLIVTMVQRSSNPYGTIYYGVHSDANCTHFVQDDDHLDAYTNPSTLNFGWETNANIPDIRLLGGCGGSVNTCLAPEVEVTAVDTHSVSLQWAQRGSESLWKVEYRPVGTGAWQLAGTTGATSFTINGLAQATHYLVRVGAVCTDSLVAYGFPDSATTLCGYMELPYTISFLADEYPCWTLAGNVYHNYWNGVSLSQWNNDYIISPEVNADISGLRAVITSLCPVAESYESRFAVGVCNAVGGNVTWIDTIEFLQQYTVQTDEVHFNHYTGSGRYIIIKGVEGTSCIRQFTLEAFSGCVPVHDVTVGAIDEHSAQLAWVPELVTNTWAVYLDGNLVASTTTPSYTLTGLNSNTQYTVSVSEICSPGDTSTAVPRMFHTLCDAFALPYFEEFDQAPLIGSEHILTDCWILHAAGDNAQAYCIGDQWTYTCLSFYDNYDGYDVVNYLSSPSLTVGGGGALVSFKGQTTAFDTFTVGLMFNPYDTSTFIPVRNITVSSGGMAWYSFSTDTIAGAPTGGTFTVAFRFNGENSGLIDSLTVTANPLPEYTLTLAVNDPAMGSVEGAGTYEEGSLVTVTAVPNEGYRFVMWSDSVFTATRVLDMNKNITLIAYFAPDTVWHTVTVTAVMDDGSHRVDLDGMVHGAGRYADGDTVTLEGEVHGCDISFVFWLTAEGDTLFDNPYSFAIHSDVSLTAVFAEFGAIDELPVLNSQFSVYPNPASTTVTIVLNDGLTVMGETLEVLDPQGRKVAEFEIRNSKSEIDISTLPVGVYFLRLKGVGTAKMVKGE